MVLGACGLSAGLLIPFLVPGLAVLYLSAMLIGMCYIFYVVTVQNLVGSIGEGHARTRNYSIFSLGVALTALFGPMTAGFSIDLIGHRYTYLLLAAVPVVPILALLTYSRLLPPMKSKHEKRHGQRLADLLRDRPLRRALLAAGIIETGLELFNLFLPIYGHSIGLTASQIGLCMGAFAAALMLVRTLMPWLARRMTEEGVLSASLFLAAATCLIFPFVTSFGLLALVAFVLGLGLGCGSPLSMILAYNRAPPGRSGEAIGLRQMVNKATEMAMPLVFGMLGTALGMIPVFWLDAVLLAGGAVLMRKDAHGAHHTRPAAAEPPPR
jgi:MFS family permease